MANKLRTYVEITLRDQDRNETLLRIEAPEITAKYTPNGAPFIFKVKPDHYVLSLFSIRTYEQMVDGEKYTAGHTPHIPNRSIMFDVTEKNVVHIGSFSYTQEATPFANGFRLKGDLKVAHNKPNEELWKPTLQALSGLKLRYLAPKESRLEAVTWQ